MRFTRPRWKPVRERNPVAVALAGIALIAGLSLLAYNAADLPLIGGGTSYTADFTEAAGLRPGNEVRVAGVKVGSVDGVRLGRGADRGLVVVTFKVRDTWIGDASTASIAIKTLLGDKYLAVDPLGAARQDPRRRIPASRTVSPYDVTQAFQDLSGTIEQLDSAKVAQSLEAIATTFAGTPPSIHQALTGLSALSKTISSRDARLAALLKGARQVGDTLAGQSAQLATLLKDGNLLLAEIQRRRDAIHGLLTGATALSQQISGLVNDNARSLKPTLDALGRVITVLQDNQDNLTKALAIAGPYTRLLGNTLGNGHWMDGYLCGLVPKSYLGQSGPAADCTPNRKGGR